MKIIEFNLKKIQQRLLDLQQSAFEKKKDISQLELLLSFKSKVLEQKYPQLLASIEEMAIELNKEKKCASLSDTINGFLIVHKLEDDTFAKKLHELRKRDITKPFLSVLPLGFDYKSMIKQDGYSTQEFNFISQYLDKYWPGRNTFIFKKNKNIKYPAGENIALRMPSIYDNIIFCTLLHLVNQPLLAPSLNYPNQEVLTTQKEIENTFGSKLEYGLFDFNQENTQNKASNLYSFLLDKHQLNKIR